MNLNSIFIMGMYLEPVFYDILIKVSVITTTFDRK